MDQPIQSAINISEGRRAGVIETVAEAVRSTQGAVLADYSADEDHNRMVVTVLGEADAVSKAAFAVARVAVEQIDLRHHTGAHPRIGAVDVIPFTPLRGISLLECVDLSRRLGERIGHELGVPVYYYEASAGHNRPTGLPAVRAAGFEGLMAAPLIGDRAPDVGPHTAHPSAGAVIIGARMPLVAYNVDLDSSDVALARRIAGSIRRGREARPELKGVRALGLWLPKRGRAQVSMNITQPDETPLPPVFDIIRSEAELAGARIWGSELIGLVPRKSLGGEGPERIQWHAYRETQMLDYWLERL